MANDSGAEVDPYFGQFYGAAIKGDRLTRISGQGSETVNQRLHDRFGRAIFVAHDDGVEAHMLHQGRHVHFPMLAVEHHQIALPVAELSALGNALGPMKQALRIKDI